MRNMEMGISTSQTSLSPLRCQFPQFFEPFLAIYIVLDHLGETSCSNSSHRQERTRPIRPCKSNSQRSSQRQHANKTVLQPTFPATNKTNRHLVYRSSSSLGRGASGGRSLTWRYTAGSKWTSGGLMAICSMNWRLGSFARVRASQRKGFSKL